LLKVLELRERVRNSPEVHSSVNFSKNWKLVTAKDLPSTENFLKTTRSLFFA